ncbi:DUF805 domain-containing protein [Emcibacter sp.]|uniref:DUF805 domain-containing protein n=1 Tax=Emcibacter sp. TaxID=1979954 RepID=UPI002AA7ADAB|nr:DUF805 domain-containing protein [Emcibacter sp.]
MARHEILLSFFDVFFTTSGRMSRSRYWSISLPYWTVFWLVFTGIESLLGPDKTWLPTLLFFIGAINLSAKRLHDRDKAAWWLLLVIIPVIGPIWTFIELGLLKGTVGDNSYGENPLEANYDYLTVK